MGLSITRIGTNWHEYRGFSGVRNQAKGTKLLNFAKFYRGYGGWRCFALIYIENGKDYRFNSN